jgi:hypothetical protein
VTAPFGPGQHVVVTLPELGPLPGRVEDATDGRLAISLFVRPEKPLAWLRGSVSVEAATPRGVYEVSGMLKALGQGLEALVGVELDGESRIVQRRSYVRVDAVVNALVAPDADAEADERQAVVINVSGGGFRLAGADWLRIDDEFRFRILLGDDVTVTGLARVVRSDDRTARACEILEISDHERDALVRFTFDRQRAELRRRA